MKKSYLLLSVFLLLPFCQKQHDLDFWTRTGTVVENIKWEIELSDSSKVLRERNGIWLLPNVPAYVKPDTTISRHVRPKESVYSQFFDRVDQEVIHDSGEISREFYRFNEHGVELLGYETKDSTQLIAVYYPPLLVLPANLARIDSTILSESIPRIYNAALDSFSTGQKTKLSLKIIRHGKVLVDSIVTPALLAKMRLSMDASVNYGDKNLIVSDLMTMESNLLLAEKFGPVLEWGVRSRQAEEDNIRVNTDDQIHDQNQLERLEYFIEVILHRGKNIAE